MLVRGTASAKQYTMIRKLLLVFSLVVALCSRAQTSQIATLLHDGNLTNYYSGTALIDAYNMAVDGDVITLSAGLFNAVNIEKNITVRGAGMGLVEAGDDYVPTMINGKFSITCPDSENHHLVLEGLQLNAQVTIVKADNFTISKCSIEDAYSNIGDEWNNFIITQSYIKDLSAPDIATGQVFNSVIGDLSVSTKTTYNVSFTNCVFDQMGTYGFQFYNTSFENCIFLAKDKDSTAIYATSSALHCLFYRVHNYGSSLTNRTVESRGEIFTDEGFYELTEEAKAFAGTDGTEVGIHGGVLPFDTTPSNPRITKFNVSPKTTADGKLSIDIEVHGAE